MGDEKAVMAVIRAARPTFRNNKDKLAFSVHASFLAAGYLLTATGPSAFSTSALSSPSTDEVGIEQWNEIEEEYAFVYINPDEKNGWKNKKKKKVLVKCLVMNDQLLVDALAEGASEPIHTELLVGEYVSQQGGSRNYAAQYKNLDKLVKKIREDIFSRLDGSSSKPR